MPPDYSSATVHLPAEYFVTHLRQMGALLERFPGLKLVQGTVEEVTVIGTTVQAQEVMQWVQRFPSLM